MKTLFFILFFSAGPYLWGQDMDSILQHMAREQDPVPVTSTFKSPKLVLLQTNETQPANNLTFWIGHRFGDIGGEYGGSHTLFGLDEATDIHIGFDYGITRRFTLGVGRSRFNETYNFQVKYRLLEQYVEGLPISATLFAQSSYITRRPYYNDEFSREQDRISHFFQFILARKFSSSLSLMVNPGYLVRSHAPDPLDRNSFVVLGMGGRLKMTRRISVIADYTWVNGLDRPTKLGTQFYDPLGIGIEIETGGHVFSLNFQNAPYITENNFIPYTQKSWEHGGIRFGFTISRDFFLGSRDDLLPEENETY